jgi:hypothetical protein
MAYIAAEMFGARSKDRFGHKLVASDGNGDLRGEGVTIEQLKSPWSYTKEELPRLSEAEDIESLHARAMQLTTILELQVEMAMNPLEGDEALNAVLDMEVQLIQEGKLDRESIAKKYPDVDVGQFLLDMLVEDDANCITVGEIVEAAVEAELVSIPVFPESPDEMLRLLEELEASQAADVLDVLLAQGMVDQTEMFKTRQHDEILESPLIPA